MVIHSLSPASTAERQGASRREFLTSGLGCDIFLLEAFTVAVLAVTPGHFASVSCGASYVPEFVSP